MTDRQDLEKQLGATAALTSKTVRKARTTEHLKSILREKGPDLVFAMIQKYQEHDETEIIEFPRYTSPRKRVAENGPEYDADTNEDEPAGIAVPTEEAEFEELNPSPDILVLVDEAHRSHDKFLHANLMQALPNCAKIAFTGTPRRGLRSGLSASCTAWTWCRRRYRCATSAIGGARAAQTGR